MTFYEDLVASGREHSHTVVRVERRADRAVVTLDDPAKLNVLTARSCTSSRPRSRSSSPTPRSARSCSPAPTPASLRAAICA